MVIGSVGCPPLLVVSMCVIAVSMIVGHCVPSFRPSVVVCCGAEAFQLLPVLRKTVVCCCK